MKEKIKNYQSNIIAITVGVFIALIVPLSLIFTKLTQWNLDIYFLARVLPFLYGVLLTDFLIFFLAGFTAALISRRYKLISSIMVGLITPIIATCVTGGPFRWGTILLSITMITVSALLGGLLYTKVIAKSP